MEVLPNVHRLTIPIPNNPLGSINSYLITTDDGCILIDTGWNAPESAQAMEEQFCEVGVSFEDLRYIVITHIHPDHYGLVGRLCKDTDARLVIHEIERSLLDSRYINYEALLAEMEEWLRINGVPPTIRPRLSTASLEVLGLVAVALPDLAVRGGERIVVGDFDLEVVWTPGHAPGHICLWDRDRDVLFTGDHVLPDITSHVSMTSQSRGNPLVDYRSSLDQVVKLPVRLAMPGHGEPFGDFAGRVAEILHHHDERLSEVLGLCQDGPLTAYEVAARATWYTRWDDLTWYDKRMAVTETLAHLELLLAKAQVTKVIECGMFRYAASGAG